MRPFLLLLLPATGCALHRPEAPPPPDTMAAVLRAEDRRVVDDRLRAALQSPDAAMRGRAVRALGRMRLPAERLRLEAALSDVAAGVRAEAARGLALLADPASLQSLNMAAKDPESAVRARAVEALGHVAAQAGSETVRAALADPDPAVVRAAALAVWRLPDGLEAIDRLAAATRARSLEVQRAAAYALGRMAAAGLGPVVSGSTPPVPTDAQRAALRDALLPLAAAHDPELRMQAARGLAHPGRPSEEQALDRLSADPDARVRVHTARSLAWEKGPVGPALTRLLEDNDLLVSQAAVEALGRIKTSEAGECLRGAVSGHGPGWLAAAALDTLSAFDAGAAADLAHSYVAAPEPRLRAAVARALGAKMPDALLADRNLTVQSAAVAALAGADPFDPRLVPFAGGDDPILRASVAEALGAKMEIVEGFAWIEASGRLEALWKRGQADAVPDARDAVVEAMGHRKPEPTIHEFLIQALSDRDWLVRRRAAEVLKRVYEEDHDAAIGAASERPVEHYAAVLRWAAEPHRASFQLEHGSFTARLDCEQAPLTCLNVACLANAGFYDGHRVHRVVPNFVIQDGDPRGDGSGGPGYAVRDEVGMPFGPGVLGMASAGYDTPGSQWFVTSSAQPHLDLRYTAFGTVIDGFERVPRVLIGEPVRAIRVDGAATTAGLCGPDPRSP